MFTQNNRRFNLTDPPGIPCPECGNTIQFSMEKLLAARPVFCANCGLKLELSREESKTGLQTLRQLSETLDKLDHKG